MAKISFTGCSGSCPPLSAITQDFKLRDQTLKNKTKQTTNKQTKQEKTPGENSKHVMKAAHTLAVNIFKIHTSVTNKIERWI